MAVLQLEITEREATIVDFNPRAELNGEERRPAADIKFIVNMGSDVLAHFAPTLRAHLFNEKGPRDLADGLPLRYPELGAFAWNADMINATLKIETGVSGEGTLKFEEAKISKFVIDPREGGGVVLSFRAQVHPDEKQAGKLSMMVQQPATITLVPAPLVEMKEAA